MTDSLLNTLSENPQTRLEMHIILKQMSLFGNDVNALRILKTIGMRDAFSKAKFLRSLPPALETLPERVLINRALPPLLEELKDMKAAKFALPSILYVLIRAFGVGGLTMIHICPYQLTSHSHPTS